MQLTYFTNRYPAVSHTFIRREIEAMEVEGVKVDRVSLRSDPITQLVDELDRDEYTRTHRLLTPSWLLSVLKVLSAAATIPLLSVRTLIYALKLGHRSAISSAKMTAYWAEALLLLARTRETRADLVRVHFGTNGAIIARLARRMGGPPYSIAFHGPDEFDAPERWDVGGVVSESAFVSAISSYCSAQIMRWSSPADWAKIHEIPCIVDVATFAPSPMPTLPLRLLTVARLAPQKGLPLLLDALARTGTGITLDIVGDGPGEQALKARANLLNLNERVRFLGARDGVGVREALGAAHIFVLPSFAEGLPVVIMEALASGRPVIATSVGAIGELVDADCGWLIPPGNVDALIVALGAAKHSDLNRLGAMGLRGREKISERNAALSVSRRLMDACVAYL